MVKKQLYITYAHVKKPLRNANFLVHLKGKKDNDVEIIAHAAGKVKQNRVRILAGDIVKLEIPMSELPLSSKSKARIVFRYKDTNFNKDEFDN